MIGGIRLYGRKADKGLHNVWYHYLLRPSLKKRELREESGGG